MALPRGIGRQQRPEARGLAHGSLRGPVEDTPQQTGQRRAHAPAGPRRTKDVVAPEQLVGALPRQHHRHARPTLLFGQQEAADRHGDGLRHLQRLDRSRQPGRVDGARQHLARPRSQVTRDLARERPLVEPGIVEHDRKRREPLPLPARQRGHGGGVDAARHPHPHGHVRHEVAAHRVVERLPQRLRQLAHAAAAVLSTRRERRPPPAARSLHGATGVGDERVRRAELQDVPEHRARRARVGEREEVVQRVAIDRRLHQARREDRLHLGCRDEVVRRPRPVERLDAHAVAREKEPAARAVPEREGEHPAHPVHHGVAVLLVEVRQQGGVARVGQRVAGVPEGPPEGIGGVELAVVDAGDARARAALHRLGAPVGVDDGETHGPQLHIVVGEGAVPVGAPVGDCRQHPPHRLRSRERAFPEPKDHGDSAHYLGRLPGQDDPRAPRRAERRSSPPARRVDDPRRGRGHGRPSCSCARCPAPGRPAPGPRCTIASSRGTPRASPCPCRRRTSAPSPPSPGSARPRRGRGSPVASRAPRRPSSRSPSSRSMPRRTSASSTRPPCPTTSAPPGSPTGPVPSRETCWPAGWAGTWGTASPSRARSSRRPTAPPGPSRSAASTRPKPRRWTGRRCCCAGTTSTSDRPTGDAGTWAPWCPGPSTVRRRPRSPSASTGRSRTAALRPSARTRAPSAPRSSAGRRPCWALSTRSRPAPSACSPSSSPTPWPWARASGRASTPCSASWGSPRGTWQGSSSPRGWRSARRGRRPESSRRNSCSRPAWPAGSRSGR